MLKTTFVCRTRDLGSVQTDYLLFLYLENREQNTKYFIPFYNFSSIHSSLQWTLAFSRFLSTRALKKERKVFMNSKGKGKPVPLQVRGA